MQNEPRGMPIDRASRKAKSEHVFGQARKRSKTFGAGLYARIAKNDPQTLPIRTGPCASMPNAVVG